MSGAKLERDIRKMSRAEARSLRAEVLALRDRVREMRRQHSGAVATERAARLERRREINAAIQDLKKRASGDVVHYQTEAGLLRLEFSNWWRAVLEERARRREELRIALVALKHRRRQVPQLLRESIRTARAEAKATAARLRAERAQIREGIRKDRHDLRAARELHKRAASRARSPAQRGASRRAVEKWHEKLDGMAHNLPPELLRAWPMARSAVMAAARKRKAITGDGLAELVGEWAEAHAGELAGREQSEADRDVARMVAEHEAAAAPSAEDLSFRAAIRRAHKLARQYRNSHAPAADELPRLYRARDRAWSLARWAQDGEDKIAELNHEIAAAVENHDMLRRMYLDARTSALAPVRSVSPEEQSFRDELKIARAREALPPF
jgi:hypothetical protein